jgi:hypothetical protein
MSGIEGAHMASNVISCNLGLGHECGRYLSTHEVYIRVMKSLADSLDVLEVRVINQLTTYPLPFLAPVALSR